MGGLSALAEPLPCKGGQAAHGTRPVILSAPMESTKTLSDKSAELDKLRRELFRLIVKNEALRRAARKSPAT